MMRPDNFSQNFRVTAWFFFISLLVGCNLPAGGPGPAVWIDRPLAGDQAPIAQPVIIQAHASDVDGVARFEFFADGSLLGIVPSSGGRLGEASLEWQPPGPGIYLLGARAEDTLGHQGATVTVQITVRSSAEGTVTPPPVISSEQCAVTALVAPVLLSPADGAIMASLPMLAWSYPDTTCHPASYAVDIAPDASFSDLSLGFGTLDYHETSRSWPLPVGQCYYWRVRAYVPDFSGPPSSAWSFCIEAQATATSQSPSFTLTQNAHCRRGPGTAYDSVDVLMQGATLSIEGRNEDNSWFWVLKPSSSGHCWVSASVGIASGNWQTVPVVAAPPLPTATAPAPPADTTPPVISDLSATPAILSVQTQCGATPATTLISARVTDSGGVQRVVARIAGMGEFEMTPLGGGLYQATLGPFYEAGTLSIFVQAWDKAGNGAASPPLTVQVVACPG